MQAEITLLKRKVMAKKSTKTTSKAPEEEETYSALVLRINPSEMNSIIGKAPPPRELTSVDIDEDGVEAMVKPVLRSLEAKVSSYYGRAMEVSLVSTCQIYHNSSGFLPL